LFSEKIGNRDYILSFAYVTLDEDAEYMAVARNLAGEARSSAQLIVNLPLAGEHSLVTLSSSSHRLQLMRTLMVLRHH